MTDTSRLLDDLSRQLTPVRPGEALARLFLGVGGGFVVSTVVMLAAMGLRPDLGQAVQAPFFWIKFGYTMVLAVLGLWAVDRVARPGMRARGELAAMGLVFAAVALLALVQLFVAPTQDRAALVFGATASQCPFNIVALSAPIFVGAFWALRGLAPTRPGFAGAVAGLTAGAAGAFVYSFYCIENAVPFLAIWYSLGIVAVGAVGAILGRGLLRW